MKSWRNRRELAVAAFLGCILLGLGIWAPAFYQVQPLLSLATREAPALIVTCGMAIVILTRWEEFAQLPRRLAGRENPPLVVDGRRMLERGSVTRYAGIGWTDQVKGEER